MFDLDRWQNKPASGAIQKDQMVSRSTDGIGEWRHANRSGANICFADGHVVLWKEKSIPNNFYENSDTGYFRSTAQSN